MEIYLTIALTVAAYLIGSISFSYILAKKAAGLDIRKVDLKTAGAVNVIINVGPKTGVIAGMLDFLKTFLIVIMGNLIGLSLTDIFIAASFGIIGHCFPVFHKFYGGRGAAPVIGIFAYFIPLELVISAIPALIIASLIRKWGTIPLFIIGFCPIEVYLLKRPQPLVFAVAYITLLTALLNGIITVYGREQKVHADR
jgi:glycerol-3-phosphate acyltransferase PlsY